MNVQVGGLKDDPARPSSVRFGAGRASELPTTCAELGIFSPLFVVDPGLAGQAVFRRRVSDCEAAGLRPDVFDGVRPNPTLVSVEAGAEQFTKGMHDGIVGFGGGTAIDAAKAIGLAVSLGGTAAMAPVPGPRALPRQAPAGAAPLTPLIAIPTTAGSGAEMRAGIVISDREGRRKLIFGHAGTLPRIVLADPELTVGLPPNLTASTGMNALAHCLEAYCSRGAEPDADGVALEGAALVARWLRGAVRNGDDLQARAGMLSAAALGGRLFTHGYGAGQALVGPITAMREIQHSLVTAVILPHVLRFNRPAIEGKMARLAATVGADTPELDGFLAWLRSLGDDLGIPRSLSAFGLDGDMLAGLASEAAADPFAADNPVPLDEGAAREIYMAALAN